MIVYDSKLKIYSSSKINNKRFFSGFATKAQGDGRKLENIKRVLGLNASSIAIPQQIHSANIQLVPSSNEKVISIVETDGLLTREEQVALTVITADCMPIIYADEKTGLVGISHQGWRGLNQKLPLKIVDTFRQAGSKPEDIICAIGPSIGACCYEVGNDVYQAFQLAFSNYVDTVFENREGKKYLNLIRLSYNLLLEGGVLATNIDFFPFCTKCNEEKFFSYRRTGGSDFPEQFSFISKRL